MEKGYNGWSNWETWLCKLWMDQNGLTNELNDVVKSGKSDTYDLSQIIQGYYEAEAESLPTSGFFTDLINGSLREINWYEIAENIQSNQ